MLAALVSNAGNLGECSDIRRLPSISNDQTASIRDIYWPQVFCLTSSFWNNILCFEKYIGGDRNGVDSSNWDSIGALCVVYHRLFLEAGYEAVRKMGA